MKESYRKTRNLREKKRQPREILLKELSTKPELQERWWFGGQLL